jgi:type II secretory ATPase GspE/PulE/Tfp pilus assembly ATPase PilB-like protein
MADSQITRKNLQNAIIEGNIPTMLEAMMRLSLDMHASDIHIEPRKNIVQLRLRIDGVLRIMVEYPTNLHPGLISHLWGSLKMPTSLMLLRIAKAV